MKVAKWGFLITLFTLALPPSGCQTTRAEEPSYIMPIVRVVDGDTIETVLPTNIPELRRVYIRVAGIDTPEKGRRAKCQLEANLGDQATLFTKKLIQTNGVQTMVVTELGWDKFGGRIDGYVIINGINLGQALINAGLARPYDGGTKSSWCS